MSLIDHDNLEEFLDPRNYDIEEAAASRPAARFYGNLAAAHGGAVLEIACGSALVAIELAARGLDVTGVDLSAPMLAHARAKSVARGLSLDFFRADARDFDLGRRFDVVYMAGNAFQAMLTDHDQQALLSMVDRHLADDGLFAFETRNPGGHDLVDQAECEWQRYRDVDGVEVVVSGSQRYDASTALLHWTTWRRRRVDGVETVRTSRIACRFSDLAHVAACLARQGLVPTACFGGFDGEAFTPRSASMVIVARRADRPRRTAPAGPAAGSGPAPGR